MLEISHENLDDIFDSAPYRVTIGNRQVLVDPGDKGEPGDLVVVWPKRRAPIVLRKLARREPFRDYWFATDAEEVVSMPCNRVSAIHRVVES